MTNDQNDIENRLWSAADKLWANPGLKPSEYAAPVLSLIFLRYTDEKGRGRSEESRSKLLGNIEEGKAGARMAGTPTIARCGSTGQGKVAHADSTNEAGNAAQFGVWMGHWRKKANRLTHNITCVTMQMGSTRSLSFEITAATS